MKIDKPAPPTFFTTMEVTIAAETVAEAPAEPAPTETQTVTVKYSIGTYQKMSQNKLKNKQQERRARAIALRKKRQRLANMVYGRPKHNPYTIDFTEKKWLILPDVPYQVMNFIFWLKTNNIIVIMSAVCSRQSDLTKKSYKQVIYKNQRVRNAFSVFIRRWIYLRKFKQGNTEDLMTGDVPLDPILVNDWDSRTTYVFEPRTIFRDIISRLQTPMYMMFPKPQLPRNPYTNSTLTEWQFFQIVKELRLRGLVHWAIEALYTLNYSITRFEKEMYQTLKKNNIKTLFANPENIDGNTLLLEFIGDSFGENEIGFPKFAYVWALNNAKNHPHLQEWRNICYSHYSSESSSTIRSETIKNKAEILCNRASHIVKYYFSKVPDAPKYEPKVDSESESESDSDSEAAPVVPAVIPDILAAEVVWVFDANGIIAGIADADDEAETESDSESEPGPFDVFE